MNFFIEDAIAIGTAATPSTAQGILSMLPMIAILILFMYFLVIRPQSKRAKDQKKLMDSLQKGDEVMTIGGILGKIEKMADDFITLNIAENTNITIRKSSIANVVPRGTIKSAQ
ncbi:MAG: preprotein translocase subunit YajC [bacterium]